MEDRLVAIPEAAALLSVSKRTVYRLIASGEIRAVHVGSRLRIPLQQLPLREAS